MDKDRFYKVSELNQSDVIKWCEEAGITEDEFIENEMKTMKYALRDFFRG